NTSGVYGRQDNENQGSSDSAWNSETRYQSYQSDYSYGSNGSGNGFDGSNSYNGNSEKGSGKKQKEKKGSGFFGKVAVSVCMGLFFGLFAGVGFFGVQQLTGNMTGNGGGKGSEQEVISGQVDVTVDDAVIEESKSGIKLTDTTEVRVISSDVTDVVEEVMPAMVSIVNNYTETVTSFFGQSYAQERAASGSGIIVAESETELLIVSNHHVVADAEKLDVTFIDGTVAQAQIKGLDSDMDLAVIAIPLESLTEETKSAIAIATLGDSASLKMGEPVVAIGNALGYGQSVTNGIVSALDREVTIEEGVTNTFIQTNAAINPGNSGGALLNVNGEVIGINSNKIGATAVEGMCYAIPISAAKPIIADLMLKETRSKVEDGKVGYMGIGMVTIPSDYSQMYNIPIGVFVREVEEGSPAKEAGFMYGDIIVKFEGEKISTNQDLQNVLQYYSAGSTVTVTVKRFQNGEYQEVELSVKLGERPKDN
ncbi:MAG: trypsin-like peptidase domain-containing protein, partial [Lachnospiraceae bacterium]|nr:trypsin-like peptidase domain-containing protein [Lachnospiraceae bacterium]